MKKILFCLLIATMVMVFGAPAGAQQWNRAFPRPGDMEKYSMMTNYPIAVFQQETGSPIAIMMTRTGNISASGTVAAATGSFTTVSGLNGYFTDGHFTGALLGATATFATTTFTGPVSATSIRATNTDQNSMGVWGSNSSNGYGVFGSNSDVGAGIAGLASATGTAIYATADTSGTLYVGDHWGTSGNLLQLQVNSNDRFRVNYAGDIATVGNITSIGNVTAATGTVAAYAGSFNTLYSSSMFSGATDSVKIGTYQAMASMGTASTTYAQGGYATVTTGNSTVAVTFPVAFRSLITIVPGAGAATDCFVIFPTKSGFVFSLPGAAGADTRCYWMAMGN